MFGDCHNSTVCLCNENLCNDFQVDKDGMKKKKSCSGERKCNYSSSSDNDDDQPDERLLLRAAEEWERPSVDASDLWLGGNLVHAPHITQQYRL